MAVEIIKSIAVALVDKIVRFVPSIEGKVQLSVINWYDMKIHPASGTYSCASKNSKAGRYYITTISARLREEVPYSWYGIIKVELCTGKSLIIGTPDVPVLIEYSMNLNIQRVNISHESVNQPFELTL